MKLFTGFSETRRQVSAISAALSFSSLSAGSGVCGFRPLCREKTNSARGAVKVRVSLAEKDRLSGLMSISSLWPTVPSSFAKASEGRGPAKLLLSEADPPSGAADLSSPAFLNVYRERAESERKSLEKTMLSAGVQWIDIPVERDIYDPVVKFFRQRQKKIRI